MTAATRVALSWFSMSILYQTGESGRKKEDAQNQDIMIGRQNETIGEIRGMRWNANLLIKTSSRRSVSISAAASSPSDHPAKALPFPVRS